MAHGVGERLGRDAEHRHLGGGGQRWQGLRHLHRHDRAVGAGQLFGALAQCADEAQLVQGWRAQVVDQPAHIVDGRRGTGAQLPQHLGRTVRVGVHEVAGGLGLEAQPGEQRAQPVVQVAAQPAALFLASGDDALPRLLQLRRQGGRVQGHRQRRREQLQHAAVGGVEPPLAPAQTDDQLAVHALERHRDHQLRRAARDGERFRSGAQGSERQPQGVAQHVEHLGQSRAGIREPPAHPRGGSHRVRAVAVERPVDDPLEAHARRVEGQRDQQRWRQRTRPAPARGPRRRRAPPGPPRLRPRRR